MLPASTRTPSWNECATRLSSDALSAFTRASVCLTGLRARKWMVSTSTCTHASLGTTQCMTSEQSTRPCSSLDSVSSLTSSTGRASNRSLADTPAACSTTKSHTRYGCATRDTSIRRVRTFTASNSLTRPTRRTSLASTPQLRKVEQSSRTSGTVLPNSHLSLSRRMICFSLTRPTNTFLLSRTSSACGPSTVLSSSEQE